MSHGVSSSEEEEELQQEKRERTFECPADFVPFQYSCRAATKVGKKGENVEMWLIKAPASFNHNSFANLKLSLSGLETIQPAGASKVYSVLASHSAPADLSLLTSSGEDGTISLCSSGFAGVLNISESYGDCSYNQNPIPVPAAPAPSIPPGLKQRFQPFGSSTATRVSENSTVKRVKLEPEADDEQRKKRKKKKERHCDEGSAEVFQIKEEKLCCESEQVLGLKEEEYDGMVKKKKKNKVKKEKDMQSEEDDGSLMVKEEPVDTSCDKTHSSKKKKKKKKNKTHE